MAQTCLYVQLLAKLLKVEEHNMCTIKLWTETDTVKHFDRGERKINIARAPGMNSLGVLQHVWYWQE